MLALALKRAAAALAAACCAFLGCAAAVLSDGPPAEAQSPAAGAVAFGPILDWTTDSAAAYVHRLGARPSVFGQAVHYPLSRSDGRYLGQFLAQVAAQHCVALLDLEPTRPLAELTTADAARFAHLLRALHARYGTHVDVRFAREMNGSWTIWGQQPRAYVTAFRTVANAVHRALPRQAAQLVWAPVYGAGYPFGRSYGRVLKSGPVIAAQLDTNHDGRVDDADDAYAPYWPGARYVDWVGLSMYDYGLRQRFGANVVAAPGRFLAELHGRYGYATRQGAGRDFAADYARHRPMLVETAALYDPGRPGPSELAVKQSWWRQVLAPGVRRAVPSLRMIAWLERRRPEAEVGNREVDWRATHTPRLAHALLQTLAADGLDIHPLPASDPSGPSSAGSSAAASSAARRSATGAQPGPTSATTFTVIGATAVVAIGVALDQRRRRIRRQRRD